MNTALLNIIKKPLISEKSAALAEIAGKYVFEVDLDSNKHQIREAVEQTFKVKVAKVHTARMPGRVSRFGRYVSPKKPWKKAFVTLVDGQKIEFFEGK